MNSPRNNRGFSLVELMIAASLTGLTTGGMLMMITQTSGQSNANNKTALVRQELTAAQNLISDEAQQAATLFGGSGFTTTVPNTYGTIRPVLGFYQPDTANSGRYFFKMFFLTSAPSSPTGAFAGPYVLYYYQNTISSTLSASQLLTAPASVAANSGSFSLVADYLRNPADTTNALINTTNCPTPSQINTASIVAGDTSTGKKYAGTVYLNGVAWNILGKQSTACTARELNLTTRITARN